ncbi:MAG: hypothetical protein ACLQHL_14230 [Candidatus Cybelea sp.]
MTRPGSLSLYKSPGELSAFLDGDAIPQFDIPESLLVTLRDYLP